MHHFLYILQHTPHTPLCTAWHALQLTLHEQLERHAHADAQLVDVGDAGPHEPLQQRRQDRQSSNLAHLVLPAGQGVGERSTATCIKQG